MISMTATNAAKNCKYFIMTFPEMKTQILLIISIDDLHSPLK